MLSVPVRYIWRPWQVVRSRGRNASAPLAGSTTRPAE
jgi:hypothetical protein